MKSQNVKRLDRSLNVVKVAKNQAKLIKGGGIGVDDILSG